MGEGASSEGPRGWEVKIRLTQGVKLGEGAGDRQSILIHTEHLYSVRRVRFQPFQHGGGYVAVH